MQNMEEEKEKLEAFCEKSMKEVRNWRHYACEQWVVIIIMGMVTAIFHVASCHQ